MTTLLVHCVRLGALTLTIACGSLALAEQDPAAKPVQEATENPEQTASKIVFVQMKTSKGDILLELDKARAPLTVENFLEYVKNGFYDGTIFHRVISNFMIQGGGFTPDMVQKETRKPIKNEWANGLKNKTGTIAMARTNNPDSATSQFFINVKDNDFLSTAQGGGAGYAVFGKVVAGMDVVNAIRVTPVTTKGRYGDVPVTPVVIEKTMVIGAEKAREIIAADGDDEQKSAPEE